MSEEHKVEWKVVMAYDTRKVFLASNKELSFESVMEYIRMDGGDMGGFEAHDMYEEYNRLKELYYYHITMVRKV